MQAPLRLAAVAVALIATALAHGWPSLEESVPSELYEQYLEAQKKRGPSKLPDYSHAGYRRCEEPLPEVTKRSHKHFDVTKYGAKPNDGRSDRKAVVKALAKAHKHRGPAAVYFPPGTYRLAERSDVGQPPIEVRRSGIVLKGSGAGSTFLVFDEAPVLGQPVIALRSSSEKEDYWRGDAKLEVGTVTPVDAFTIEVGNASGIEEGMRLNLNANMDPHKAAEAGYYGPHATLPGILSRAESKGGTLTDLFELHEVEKVKKKRVTFAEPIHLQLEHCASVDVRLLENTIEECGIEDLSLRGGFRAQFKHHNGSRYGEDFRMISFDRVFHSWARRLRIEDYSSGIETWLSGFNTFSDIVLEGNAGHNSVTSKSSYGNLFAYVREYTDTHHGLGVARSGVNSVFLRCVQFSGMEAHCGYPRATLFDLNEGGFAPRGGGATFFPMHDEGLTFWNWKVAFPGSFDFWPEGQKHGYFLRPVIAGLHGERFDIPDIETDLLAYESPGVRVEPESLFEAQLGRRLKKTPRWLLEASGNFERSSRHAGVELLEPTDQTRYPGSSIPVRVKLRAGLALDQVESIELLASRTSLWEDFEVVAAIDLESLEASFEPPAQGVWVVRPRLTNSRGEISHGGRSTIFVGDDEGLSVEVDAVAFLGGRDKEQLYKDFVANGGGEAPELPESEVLADRRERPVHEIEEDYREELAAFYREYGETHLMPLLKNERAVRTAESLFDGDLDTRVSGLDHYMDALVQVRFEKPQILNRLDLHWRGGRVPDRYARLELQTTRDVDSAWTSVVNDERAWEFSVARLGSTLLGAKLPGEEVTTLYFPEREVNGVRVLLGGFPDEVTELQFYGP